VPKAAHRAGLQPLDLGSSPYCYVLQGYALTECKPVTCPPVSSSLLRPGSVGVAVGPVVAVMGDDGLPRHTNATGEMLPCAPWSWVGVS
jgi:hypothetical protein